MTEKKLRIFKENYKKCKKKSTLKIIFKFFAMACSYTTYVLDTDPTFIIQIRIHRSGSASLL